RRDPDSPVDLPFFCATRRSRHGDSARPHDLLHDPVRRPALRAGRLRAESDDPLRGARRRRTGGGPGAPGRPEERLCRHLPAYRAALSARRDDQGARLRRHGRDNRATDDDAARRLRDHPRAKRDPLLGGPDQSRQIGSSRENQPRVTKGDGTTEAQRTQRDVGENGNKSYSVPPRCPLCLCGSVLYAAISRIGGRSMRLGVDSYSLRWQGWDAFELLDYAGRLGLDNVHFSERRNFASLDEDYLRRLKRRADELGLAIEVGMGSFDRFSTSFRAELGSGEEQLGDMLRA